MLPPNSGNRSSCMFALSETFMRESEYLATLTCPECGFQEDLEMPTDYCQFFHNCSNCKTVLRPKAGDDCVFCSYSDKLCPPKLIEEATP